jgi:Fe-S cluster assembly iron-binding protein IscA
MALDELQDNDVIFTDKDITYLIEKELFDQAKPIKVDYVESSPGAGFQLTSSLPSGGNCGGCC